MCSHELFTQVVILRTYIFFVIYIGCSTDEERSADGSAALVFSSPWKHAADLPSRKTEGSVHTILKEQVSRFWFDRQPRNINEPSLLRRRCVHADKMAEEKGRKKGDTNNPVMQIYTADFKVKTGTGI